MRGIVPDAPKDAHLHGLVTTVHEVSGLGSEEFRTTAYFLVYGATAFCVNDKSTGRKTPARMFYDTSGLTLFFTLDLLYNFGDEE
jgi:hypothetical protein